MQNSTISLYLFSLPRSGSTAVQDFLYRNIDKSTTAPETWILPYLLAASEKICFSPIGLDAARIAESQFGVGLYQRYAVDGAKSFFSDRLKMHEGSEIFIEKTPRNILHAKAILNYDKSAHAIILIRHPVDIILSCFLYFEKGRPNYHKLSIDLVDGMRSLNDLINSGTHPVMKYEDFVEAPNETAKSAIEQCGLVFDGFNSLYDSNKLVANAKMGDRKFIDSSVWRRRTSRYMHAEQKISWFTYRVICQFLRHRPYASILERYYDTNTIAVKNVLRRNVKSVGLGDAISYTFWLTISALNINLVIKKVRSRSPLSYLR